MKDSLLAKFIILFIIIIIIISSYLINVLINNNDTKKLIMQIKKINIAINSFSEKYHALPGDVNNTINFGLSNYNTDGNGDNFITDIYKGNIRADGEIVNFWMHLSNSRIINEKYDGLEYEMARTGSTFPKSPISNNGIIAFSDNEKNYLQIGYFYSDKYRIFTSNNTLKAKEAYLYDKKIDDGKPENGSIVVAGGDSLNYLKNSLCYRNGEYDLNNSKPSCQVRIEIK
jgi:hypothetical protein